MLSNMPINNISRDRKRKIVYIIIGVVCAISIILSIVFSTSQEQVPPKQEEIPMEPIKEFSSVFDNRLNEQVHKATEIQKITEDKDIVYSKFDVSEKVDGKFDINVKIPTINMNNSEINEINKEIDDIFRGKARDIIRSEEDYEIIYTVEYTAYINSNILSLVIKSNLKEGSNAQRVIIKAYNYNITTNEVIDINDMIAIKQLNKSEVQKEINNTVEKNAKETQNLIDLGYKVYERNLSDSMYKIENVDNFFYGPDGVLYIIYAYGNNNYTSELDIIPIR